MRCPTCDSRYDVGSTFCTHDGAKLVPAEGGGDQLIGSVLADRYRIIKLLGEGGMGRVYEAQHVNINKRLAIKVLRSEVTSVPSTVARFRQEARSASSIGHENIIEIDDFATLPDGTVYLAMEMLEGQSLGDRMREPPPLALGEGIDIMIQVARGLAAAHEKGIVHRDMKPENVFLANKHGKLVPKILDFGIAKVSGTEGNTHLTQTGAIFGTPLYMSPEQALGHALDHRADIYSVGVILYEIAAGRVPFKADSAVQVLSQHITVQPEPPSKASKGSVPPALDAIILRAMAKEPAQRYATMDELAGALEQFAATLPPRMSEAISAISAPRATTPQPIATPQPMSSSQPVAIGQPSQLAISEEKKSSKLPFVVAAIMLLLLIGGAALWFQRKPVEVATPAPPAPEPVKEPEPAPVKEKEPPGVQIVEVVVGSVPSGAQLLHEGKVLAETPDALKVPAGESWSVVLHKDGYVDQPLTIDPAHDRKLLVKLEKISKAAPPKPAHPTKVAAATPEPPPKAPEPPAKEPEPPKPVVMVPVAPPKPTDPISQAVDRLAPSGTKRQGHVVGGHANDEDEHSDWYWQLEAGKCYDFVSTGGPGVDEIYVYLWGPNGKRATDRKEGSPSVTMHFCAPTSGQYHFQTKVAGGKGEYRTGVFVSK
jgi:serine/threonine-protein kinase